MKGDVNFVFPLYAVISTYCSLVLILLAAHCTNSYLYIEELHFYEVRMYFYSQTV